MNFNLKSKPYFIAEIGINHNGYLSLAKKMILEFKSRGRCCKISKKKYK